MSQNLYTYVGNNPVNYVDPTGHIPWLIVGGVILLVSGLSGCSNNPEEPDPIKVDYNTDMTYIYDKYGPANTEIVESGGEKFERHVYAAGTLFYGVTTPMKMMSKTEDALDGFYGNIKNIVAAAYNGDGVALYPMGDFQFDGAALDMIAEYYDAEWLKDYADDYWWDMDDKQRNEFIAAIDGTGLFTQFRGQVAFHAASQEALGTAYYLPAALERS